MIVLRSTDADQVLDVRCDKDYLSQSAKRCSQSARSTATTTKCSESPVQAIPSDKKILTLGSGCHMISSLMLRGSEETSWIRSVEGSTEFRSASATVLERWLMWLQRSWSLPRTKARGRTRARNYRFRRADPNGPRTRFMALPCPSSLLSTRTVVGGVSIPSRRESEATSETQTT